jgi:hypothetical protein
LSEQLQTVLGPLPEGYKCNTQVVSDVVQYRKSHPVEVLPSENQS